MGMNEDIGTFTSRPVFEDSGFSNDGVRLLQHAAFRNHSVSQLLKVVDFNGGPLRKVSEFCAESEDLRHLLEGNLVVEETDEEVVCIVKDKLIAKLLRVRVPSAHDNGDNDHQCHEVHHQHNVLILLVKQKRRQSYRNLHAAARTIRATGAHKVVVCLLISEDNVCVLDLLEHRRRESLLIHGFADLSIRVIQKTHLTVRLFDLFLVGALFDTENLPRVELGDLFTCHAHQKRQEKPTKYNKTKADKKRFIYDLASAIVLCKFLKLTLFQR
mmetsp:Transcript_4924/g.10209  ORF Transcript_4924/g.10209 Transcript_4924/m.10209 type:complete len:271 (-) Transcript_4924:589-1401(-)